MFSKWKTVSRENYVNRESKSIELITQLYIYCDEHEDNITCNTTVYFSHCKEILWTTYIQITNKKVIIYTQETSTRFIKIPTLDTYMDTIQGCHIHFNKIRVLVKVHHGRIDFYKITLQRKTIKIVC